MCVCVCVCVYMYMYICVYMYTYIYIYIVFFVHKIEKIVAEYCLPLIREGYGCFITSDSVQYLSCIIEQN